MPDFFFAIGLASQPTQRYNCVVVPDFDSDGVLPPGVHSASWREFCQRFGCTKHRRRLICGLREALLALQLAGCSIVYIDGSFVTAKLVPNDYDACWEIAGVDDTQLDPVFLDFSNFRAAQKAKYLGEFFPAGGRESHSGKTWLDFFQVDKPTGNAKGIVSINLGRETL